MKTITLLLAMSCFACTVHPYAYNPRTGEYVSTGHSLATKTVDEAGFATTASGTTLGYHITGKDETVLPKAYFTEKALSNIAGNVAGAFKTHELTRRSLGNQAVRRAAIDADKAVRLGTHVPEVPVGPVEVTPAAIVTPAHEFVPATGM